MLGHERIARERIVVLPAGERADATSRGVDGAKSAAVTHAPDHPLVIGGRDLAPFEHEFATRIEDELRVVKRAVVALVDAEHDAPRRACAQRASPPPFPARHHDRLCVQPQVARPPSAPPASRKRSTDNTGRPFPERRSASRRRQPRRRWQPVLFHRGRAGTQIRATTARPRRERSSRSRPNGEHVKRSRCRG